MLRSSTLILLLALGCEAGTVAPADAGPTEPPFPADYRERFLPARDCMHSHEHELLYVRVWASPDALEPYHELSPEFPYSVGATLVKEEYDSEGCQDLVGFTVMTREEPGYAPQTFDWRWQKFDAEGQPAEFNEWTCITCHQLHCNPEHPPGGFELTCASDASPSPRPQ